MSSNGSEQVYCIIGAGAAGLGAAKAFQEAGLKYEVIDSAAGPGGIWDANRTDSPVNRNTHVIASRGTQCYAGFPMPADYPDYPDHRLVLQYLRSYADHFQVSPNIRLNTKVERIEALSSQNGKAGDSGWKIKFADGSTKEYTGVVIATGHDRVPRMPELPGKSDVEVLHSNQYKEVSQILDRRVLVIGAGQSAADLLCECAMNARKTIHSTRRGFFCMPKYMLGRPTDTWLQAKAPAFMRRMSFKMLFKYLKARSKKLGIPIPKKQKEVVIPVLGDQLHHHYTHGDIHHKGDLVRMEGRRAIFDDGSSEEVDLIFQATGFSPSYEFVDREHLNWPEGAAKPSLFLHIFPPTADNLFVVGMVRPIGSHWDAYEYQGHLVAAYIRAKKAGNKSATRFDQVRLGPQPDLQAGLNFYNAGEYPLVVEKQEYVKQVLKELKRLK